MDPGAIMTPFLNNQSMHTEWPYACTQEMRFYVKTGGVVEGQI